LCFCKGWIVIVYFTSLCLHTISFNYSTCLIGNSVVMLDQAFVMCKFVGCRCGCSLLRSVLLEKFVKKMLKPCYFSIILKQCQNF